MAAVCVQWDHSVIHHDLKLFKFLMHFAVNLTYKENDRRLLNLVLTMFMKSSAWIKYKSKLISNCLTCIVNMYASTSLLIFLLRWVFSNSGCSESNPIHSICLIRKNSWNISVQPKKGGELNFKNYSNKSTQQTI